MTDLHASSAELARTEQVYGDDPTTDRETDHYRKEYVKTFVD
jgi:sarcosine/dimethylglycine N-methyltransferase